MTHPGGPPLRVLLIEDIAADADLITYELRKANIGFESRCVATRRAFLAELKESPPDAIISDFSMPQFNALDALQALRSERVEVPFILVTGSQSEEVAVECIKEGADDYILKSSLKRLPTALLSAVKKKRAEKEREDAEEALRRSEEYFRSLIENSSDIITILSEKGTIQFLSPAVERILGYEPTELLGEKVFGFVHENERLALERAFRAELQQARKARPIEYRFRHKDGTWRYLEGVCDNLLRNSAVAGIVLNSRDISERKEAEERIREQAALLNKASDAILVIDLQGSVTFWNQSAERLYGWPADEIIGAKNVSLFCAGDLGKMEEARVRTIETGEWHGEFCQSTREGKELLVESRWSLVRDKEGRPKSILLINSDVTERKKLEAHFLRAQRMESIGTLAGGIAHDLNNVLTPIVMSLKLLRDSKGDAPDDLLDTLETSAHRGANIVQQVLSFARGVEGQRTVLQIKHPLNEVIKISKDIFPKEVQIRTKVEQDLWPITGDPTQLHQVFMNLFLNAKDAMVHGGRLNVEAANTEIDDNYARMQPEAKPGKYVVVTVADSGNGIAPANLCRVFEPFFTTKEVGKGTGLGLSTAQGIIRSHGGFITVYSELGKGTSFRVYLPSAECHAGDESPSGKTTLPLGRGESILVVDDEIAVREIIKVTLEANGYKVLTASDGTEAVATFATRRSQIKLVVVDVMMPYLDGGGTVRALQKLEPSTKFLAISGLMDNEKIAELCEMGNITFLPKPFTTEQILTTLDQVLRRKGKSRSAAER